MKQPVRNEMISHHTQMGGIETSVLDNGPGRGARIAWINTGTGLRYKVIIDRAMDLADAFFNQHSLSWISHGSITSPQPFSSRGIDWLKTFGGGLMTTCGLSHVGGPEEDSYGQRGLHGEISNIPAMLDSVLQPDPANGKMEMSLTGTMKQSQVLGPNLELRRKISGELGSAIIRIHDEVVNVGNTTAPHMILYHCNFGWPLVNEGSSIIWAGQWKSREGPPGNHIFREGNDFRRCPAPLDSHAGRGEEAAIIDVEADPSGRSICGIYNPYLKIAVVLRFIKTQLPWLINWQHWGRGEYVTGLEPATHPPQGQAAARKEQTLIELEPGESRKYDLEFEVLTSMETIQPLLQSGIW